jgi:hypothetical protein
MPIQNSADGTVDLALTKRCAARHGKAVASRQEGKACIVLRDPAAWNAWSPDACYFFLSTNSYVLGPSAFTSAVSSVSRL